jgi:predicted N-acetyltransferase YhbS
MEFRLAATEELNAIYMMGHDVWSDGASTQAYLDGCRASPKYKTGTWYVLHDKEKLVASLAVYTSEFGLQPGYCGIASVATDPQKRGNGYASKLVTAVCETLQSEGAKGVYLHSDIGPSFYESLGFILVSANNSKCMVRQFSHLEPLPAEIPSYF